MRGSPPTFQASAFTTGPSPGGYTVTEAIVRFQTSDTLMRRRRSRSATTAAATRRATTVVAALTGSVDATAGDYTFSVHGGVEAGEPSTQYWLVGQRGRVSGTRAQPDLSQRQLVSPLSYCPAGLVVGANDSLVHRSAETDRLESPNRGS